MSYKTCLENNKTIFQTIMKHSKGLGVKHQCIPTDKESHWLEVSATIPIAYYSKTSRLNFDNIKMRNVNSC